MGQGISYHRLKADGVNRERRESLTAYSKDLWLTAEIS